MLARLTNKAFAVADTTDGAIPHPRDVSPRLREIEERIDKLKERRAELRREHARSVEIMREVEREKVARLAGELLADRPRETHRAPPEVHRDILAIDDALEQLRVDAATATVEASAIIRERVAPRHTALVQDMVQHMLALRQSFADYLDFARELNDRGIAWSALRPMHPSWLGEPDYRYSPVAVWLREAATYGFISREEIPEGLRHG